MYNSLVRFVEFIKFELWGPSDYNPLVSSTVTVIFSEEPAQISDSNNKLGL